jgi:hypothetical protein
MSSWSSTSRLGPVRRCAVLLRGGLRCAWCLGDPTPDDQPHGRALQVDHVVPRALGGDDSPRNLVPACGECNRARSEGWIDDRLAAEGVRRASAWQRVRRQLRTRLPTGAAVALAHVWYAWLRANREVTKAATRRWRERLAEANARAVAEGLGGAEFPFGWNAPG